MNETLVVTVPGIGRRKNPFLSQLGIEVENQLGFKTLHLPLEDKRKFSSIGEKADKGFEKLEQSLKKYSRIIFVGHSQGGLTAQAIINRLSHVNPKIETHLITVNSPNNPQEYLQAQERYEQILGKTGDDLHIGAPIIQTEASKINRLEDPIIKPNNPLTEEGIMKHHLLLNEETRKKAIKTTIAEIQSRPYNLPARQVIITPYTRVERAMTRRRQPTGIHV
ncbi:hypothetical protein HUU53_00425 [Candidatus Micrarchaeota archaeon]|nr:hypothetical protein [Candidatus Micrarchaeota archaeon]